MSRPGRGVSVSLFHQLEDLSDKGMGTEECHFKSVSLPLSPFLCPFLGPEDWVGCVLLRVACLFSTPLGGDGAVSHLYLVTPRWRSLAERSSSRVERGGLEHSREPSSA